MKVECLCCEEVFDRYPSGVGKRNFCSLKCRDKYDIESKYGHLYDTFDKYPDEVSYLFGLILGDGHQRKNTKKTIRVSIAFDINHQKLIKTFVKVAKKLKINYFIEPKAHHSCQAIGFTLPDELLKRYDMFYSGAKFDSQPYPSDEIINNIHFAAGLINSDGWCGFGKTKNTKFRTISFNNTVSSIAKALVCSLKKNNINFCENFYHRKADKRNGNIYKDYWMVRSSRQKEIDKLVEKTGVYLKEFK